MLLHQVKLPHFKHSAESETVKRKEIIHLTGDTKSEDRISSETAKMVAAHIATMMDNKSK